MPTCPRPSLRAMLRLFSCLTALLSGPVHAADPPTGCRYVQIGALPIKFGGPSLQPMVDGSIDRTPARMLLDTGANRTYLTRTGTDRRNLYLRSSGGRSVTGVGGQSAVYLVRLEEFSVGPAGGGKINMGVIDSTGWTPSFDAIVGADFLMQSDLELALADKQLKFYRPMNCKDSFLAYWDPNAMVLPVLGYGNSKVNPEVEVEINGVKLVAILDSGAAGSSITAAAAKRAGVRTDAPGVVKASSAMGVGPRRVGRWLARFDTFRIGDETIRNASIDIRESLSNLNGVDVLLGADFLRAHRVLFALSQRRVYLSYLGGTVFGRPEHGIEAWVQQEADSGNPDAAYLLAATYRAGSKVARDEAQANAWLGKAAGANHVGALLEVSRRLRAANQAPQAVLHMRAAVAALPAEPYLAFELFLAQTQAGEREAAKLDLARLTTPAGKGWPAPIADYYLGRLDEAALFKAARDDDNQAQARACQAGASISQLYTVLGDPARAKQVRESVLGDCRRTPD